MKKLLKNKKLIILLSVIVLFFILALAFVLSKFLKKDSYVADFRRINTPVDATYKALGEKIVYYDNDTLYCCSDNGSTRWTYNVGTNAGFTTTDTHLIAWRGANIYVLDSNGRSTYVDNLGQDILFARIYKNYFGAVIGTDRKSKIVVYDLKGTQIDEESESFQNTIILDFGFFGKSGEFLWTLKLDTDSTAANSILNTFEVGKMNTGELSLGNYITYSVDYDNNQIVILNTRRMLSYDYKLSKKTKEDKLVYGWELLDKEVNESENGYKLFVKSEQKDSNVSINELRLLSGNIDMRYNLPTNVFAALVSNKNLYAISSSTIYKASVYDTSFESFPLNINSNNIKYLTKLNTNKILLSDESNIYVLRLP